jgi:hypothetical protein
MAREPHFGRTRRGLAVHARVSDHLPSRTKVDRFNSWLAVKITAAVGSMWCAYLFAAIALYGLPTALKPGGEGLVSWIAQTFLQLVLLSIIIVGSNVTSAASDARAAKTFEDVETVREDVRTALDRLDTRTEGGIADVLAAVHAAITMTGHVLDVVNPAHAATAPAEVPGSPEGEAP